MPTIKQPENALFSVLRCSDSDRLLNYHAPTMHVLDKKRVGIRLATMSDGVELLDERFDKRGVVGENAVFEIALLHRLCAHPRAGEIRRTKVRLHTVDDDALEMYARTQHSLGLLRPLRGSFASLIRPT